MQKYLQLSKQTVKRIKSTIQMEEKSRDRGKKKMQIVKEERNAGKWCSMEGQVMRRKRRKMDMPKDMDVNGGAAYPGVTHQI